MTLRQVEVAGAEPYRVWIGHGALARLEEELGDRSCFVVTDPEVERLHGARLGVLASAPRRLIERGEDGKTLQSLGETLEALAEAGLGRDGVVVALGGGSVGDHAGLAAALYMRGVDIVQCPTTLLSQIDSSVGGKTAVNLRSGKNLAGAFHPPRAVLADTATLGTLPVEERASGLGELVKTGLIAGGQLLELIESAGATLIEPNPEVLAEVVELAVRAKAVVVAGDEREAGPREVLNLGHTFAHALEHATGYGRVPHGVAVAACLGLTLKASARLGLLDDPELSERLAHLLAALNLPGDLSSLAERYGLVLDVPKLEAAMLHDKKSRGGKIRLVLPVRPGQVQSGVEVEPTFLSDLLNAR